MKKIAQLLLLLIFLFSFNAFSQLKEVDIKGKWIDKEMQVEYNFSTNSKASFSQMGYGMSVSYKVDFSKSPYWIDFTLQRGGNKIKMPGLLRVINKDTIWIEQFPPYSIHPTKFSKDFTSRTRKIHVLVRKKS
jgi:hypothetical protein